MNPRHSRSCAQTPVPAMTMRWKSACARRARLPRNRHLCVRHFKQLTEQKYDYENTWNPWLHKVRSSAKICSCGGFDNSSYMRLISNLQRSNHDQMLATPCLINPKSRGDKSHETLPS